MQMQGLMYAANLTRALYKTVIGSELNRFWLSMSTIQDSFHFSTIRTPVIVFGPFGIKNKIKGEVTALSYNELLP